ncbi:COG4223 family protein [Aquamicrobium terrae]|uniref:Phage tail protein n=1 Tax=Aquamicrobium terrae TaxID=1324945 RepID=A0ABV2N7V2_9HYPH
MVKTPKTRHSKSSREPVTIDLDADQVSRIARDKAAKEEAIKEEATKAEATPEPIPPEQVSQEPQPAEAPLAEEPKVETPSEPPTGSHAQDYSFKEEPAPPPAEEPAREADRPKPFEAQPAPEPARRGGMGMLAAGIVGGVIALAGAGALQYAGVLGAPANGAASGASSSQIADLQAQISDLAAARGEDGSAQQVESLTAALDQVRSDLGTLKSAVEAGAGAGDNGAALAALSQKVEQVETTVTVLGEAAQPEPVDLAPVNEKLAALEQQVRAAGEAAEGQQSRLATLEQSLAAVTGKVEEQADQPKIALAIAASALKSALERGAPFTAELETFAAISPGAPQLDALRAHAEKGVATRTEIATQVDAAADAMVAADNPVDANAGFVQRLMSSAESLVKVRPIGAVEGAGVPETVARLEAAVNQGDYAKALGEYDTLPEPVKAAGADFAATLKARMEAEAGVDALVARTMTGGEG